MMTVHSVRCRCCGHVHTEVHVQGAKSNYPITVEMVELPDPKPLSPLLHGKRRAR